MEAHKEMKIVIGVNIFRRKLESDIPPSSRENYIKKGEILNVTKTGSGGSLEPMWWVLNHFKEEIPIFQSEAVVYQETLENDMRVASDYILGVMNAPSSKAKPMLTIDVYWAAIGLKKCVDEMENKEYRQELLLKE